jgi:hypothetical protein
MAVEWRIIIPGDDERLRLTSLEKQANKKITENKVNYKIKTDFRNSKILKS